MRRIPVIVGPCRDEQSQMLGQAEVAHRLLSVVIRVIRLECVKAGRRQMRNTGIDSGLAWMRKRRNAAGTVDDSNHLLG